MWYRNNKYSIYKSNYILQKKQPAKRNKLKIMLEALKLLDCGQTANDLLSFN